MRDAIVPGIKDSALRDRIIRYESLLAREESAFRVAISSQAPYLQRAASSQVREDMIWLYEQRLNESAPGKVIRGEILGLANGKCPLCDVGLVKTLEHSFPKSAYPRLAVDPMNLVPCCRDCNFNRGVGSGNGGMNPYVDDWATANQWLSASVVSQAQPYLLRFQPMWNPNISPAQHLRLQLHFDDYGLDERYQLQAIDEFMLLQASLVRISPTLSKEMIFEVLKERLFNCVSVRGSNHWQTAAYAAWVVEANSINWVTAV